MGSCVTRVVFSSHDHPFLCYITKTRSLFLLLSLLKEISPSHFTGLTFLFLRRITLMQSVDTTMLTFFFFIFFSLNSYCEGEKKKTVKNSQNDHLIWCDQHQISQELAEFRLFAQDIWHIGKERLDGAHRKIFLMSFFWGEMGVWVNIKKLSVSVPGSC